MKRGGTMRSPKELLDHIHDEICELSLKVKLFKVPRDVIKKGFCTYEEYKSIEQEILSLIEDVKVYRTAAKKSKEFHKNYNTN